MKSEAAFFEQSLRTAGQSAHAWDRQHIPFFASRLLEQRKEVRRVEHAIKGKLPLFWGRHAEQPFLIITEGNTVSLIILGIWSSILLAAFWASADGWENQTAFIDAMASLNFVFFTGTIQSLRSPSLMLLS